MTESLSDDRRIVVVGEGALTPLGLDADSSWNAIKRGDHGIKQIENTRLRDSEGIREIGANVIAAVPDFDIFDDPFLADHRQELASKKFWHPSALYMYMAMYQALRQARLLGQDSLQIDKSQVDSFRTGFYVGSTFAGADTVATDNKRIKLSSLFKYLPARAATAPAMPFSLNGPGALIGAECASGASTIRLGAKELLPYLPGQKADADIMVVGGTDAEFSVDNLKFFEVAQAGDKTDDPEAASTPLNKGAKGLVMGEGAAALVLETWAHAKARGLTEEDILAELVGFANLTHADNNTRAGLEGTIRVMEAAIIMANVMVGETVSWNGHHTSTGEGDPIETNAIYQAVINQGLNPKDVYLTSTKGATGHTMGAAGAIEASLAQHSLREDLIPPTLKLNDPIEEVRDLSLSPLEATQLPKVDVAISTSLGFGGTATALAFRKFKP